MIPSCNAECSTRPWFVENIEPQSLHLSYVTYSKAVKIWMARQNSAQKLILEPHIFQVLILRIFKSENDYRSEDSEIRIEKGNKYHNMSCSKGFQRFIFVSNLSQTLMHLSETQNLILSRWGSSWYFCWWKSIRRVPRHLRSKQGRNWFRRDWIKDRVISKWCQLWNGRLGWKHFL